MYEILGSIFIIALGCVGHFLYDWTGHNRFAALFFAVNESTWEHIKLAIYPTMLWLAVAMLRYGSDSNLLVAQLVALVTMIFLIPFLFYGYTLFTRHNYLIVDILCFCVSVCMGMWVFHLVITSEWVAPIWVRSLSFIGVMLITVAYFVFSMNPPHNFLFKDPITRRYGLSGHPCMHNHKHHKPGVRHPEVLFGKVSSENESKSAPNPNLEYLRNTPKVYFVAMKEEFDADSTSSEVVYMGVGKARSTRALLKWLQDNRQLIAEGKAPLIVNLGTAGSARHMRGEILLSESFVNNGDAFIKETITFNNLPQSTGIVTASSDFFVSEKNFSAGDVSMMKESFDCLDMESFALANICREAGLRFCAVKCISDGADDTVANFDAELPKFRAKLNAFAKSVE